MKVLIADDSELMRKRLIKLISGLKGIDVIEAEDCGETIKIIRELNPDVVILDIRMPGGSGINILHQIKKKKTGPTVIIFTNYPYPEYRKKCMELGADFFFDKSTEFNKISEVLKQLKEEY